MATEQSFTPGPWGVETTSTRNWIGPMRYASPGSHPRKKVYQVLCFTEREFLSDSALFRSDANAKLIAAAPQLLEACQLALSSLDKLMGDSDLNDDNSPEMVACQKLGLAIDAAIHKSV